MDLFGIGIELIAFFVGFGLLIGILFGFFGMGGSFFVTPALLVVGYPAPVAVGTGFAFVSGTSVIGALRHRAYGQVSYKLAVLMLPGMTIGIEVGKRIVFLLEGLDSADVAISAGYVGLLSAVGLLLLRAAHTGGTRAETVGIAIDVRAIEIPPTVTLRGGATVSVWVIIAISLGIGVLSGCLGVGGGFLLIPVLIYGFGIPGGIAAGTSIHQIVVSGAFGTFAYASLNAVNVPVVAALLGGSALGARIGAAATCFVNDADFEEYFAITLLAGGIAIASKQASTAHGLEALEAASAVLIFGTALLVSGAIVRASIDAFTKEQKRESPRTQ